MADLLSEVEYGRILGSFTAVAEDFGDTVAPDAIPLSGRVTFVPSKSNISYINSEGETASLYVAPVNAVISQGRIIGKDGKDGVVLLASNSNNVSASVLWNARISLDPIHPGVEAPEVHDILIEVRRGEVASLIDVIKENSRVHNIALFHDAIAEAAAKFWERVESGEFRGNQGPPGPPGVGIGVPGPAGLPGKSGKDGDPGVGGNLLPDGDLEEPGFLVTGDMQETSDAVMGNRAVTLSKATSRKIFIEPEKSYVGSVYVKSAEAATVFISQRVFGAEGDIDRVIENSYDVPAVTWRKLTFLLDTNVGDQSMEIVTQTDGRTITVDQYTLSDSSVVKGLQKELTSAKALLEGRLAQLDSELAEVDSERQRLATSLNDLATVLEDSNVDLTELNEDMASLKEDLAAEQTARQEADEAAQRVLEQLDSNLADAKTEIADNSRILEELETDLGTSKESIDQAVRNIEQLETETLPNLQRILEEANTATSDALSELDNKLYGASGDIVAAKASIEQLGSDISAESEARKQLATDVGEDFAERDTRLSEAEQVLSAAFPNGPINVESKLADTIHRSVVEYAVNSSETTPPTAGWSTDTPTRAPGKFVWFRTLITYGDGSTATSSAALMTGNTGAPGAPGPKGDKGEDGTSVKILGTKPNPGSLPTSGNTTGDGWLVDGYLYVWSGTEWVNAGLIRGPQGVQGAPGEDGAPTYTWVKYADTSTGLGMSDDPAGKRYIGLAFNKLTQTESTTADDYQWSLFEGPEGPQGDKGDPGESLYTWIKYATTPTTGMSDLPNGKDYIGVAYNKTTPTESTNYSDYQWTLIKGEKGAPGIPGVPGADGTPRYTWVKYATSSSGADMSDSPTGKSYIGLAYNKMTATESTVASDYEWSLFQGPQGVKGDKGDPGSDGLPGADGKGIKSTALAYALSTSGTTVPTTGWSSTVPTLVKGRYLWTRTTWTYTDNATEVGYSVAYAGTDGSSGSDGLPGKDGVGITGTTISYAVSSSGTTAPTTGWAAQPPSAVAGQFIWTRTVWNYSDGATETGYSVGKFGDTGAKGDKGDTGTAGVGISSITPYFRSVAATASAPAVPTTMTPSGWTTTEPAWAPNTSLYRVERVVYTNNAFAYTPVTKIAAYAGIDAAMAAANGKNLNTYTEVPSASKPGPSPAANSARTVGDIHRNRDSVTGEIFAEYQWDGKAWKSVSFGDSVLSSLDVGKVTGGTGAFQQFFADKLIAADATIEKLWVDGLAARAIATSRLAVAPGSMVTWWPRRTTTPFDISPHIKYGNGASDLRWSFDSDLGEVMDVTLTGSGFFMQLRSGVPSGVVNEFGTDPFSVKPESSYRLEMTLGAGGTYTNGHPALRASFYWYSADGTRLSVSSGSIVNAAGQQRLLYTNPERSGVTFTSPANAAYVHVFLSVENSATGHVFIGELDMRPMVGAVLIENGAVSADKINAESVAGAVGKFINLETSQLVATDSIKTPEAVINKLWADGISAKSISASRLAVAPGNLFPDPYFQDLVGWSANPNTSVVVAANPAENIFKINTFERQTGVYVRSFDTDSWVLKPGATYIVRLEAKFTGDGGNRLGLYAQGRREDGSVSTSAATFARKSVGTWDSYESTLSIPVDTTGVYRPGIYTLNPYSTGETIEVRKVEVLPMVGAVLIEDGAVNASKINAESVAAAVGQFVKVEAGNIVAGKADVDSLVAQKIASATASFQKVNAGNIVSSAATIDQAVINQIWADGIAAKSVISSQITVAAGNILVRGDGRMGRGDAVTTLSYHTDDLPSGASTWGRWELPSTTTTGHDLFPAYDDEYAIRVDPDRTYTLTYWAKNSAAKNLHYVMMNRQTPDGAYDSAYYIVSAVQVGTTWTKYQYTIKPAALAGYSRIGFTIWGNHPNAAETGVFTTAGWSLIPQVGAVLIEDGAISANHLTTNSVDTNHLRANAVSAEKIVSGAVTTDKMTANSINGDRIRANTLDAGKITSKTITATQIKAGAISATEIASRTITADKIVAGSITSNEIKARTITAAEIATGTILAEHISTDTLEVLSTLTVKNLSGEHIYGTVIEGGEIRTSNNLPGRVRIADDAFTYAGRTLPGIEIIPEDTQLMVRPAGVGPWGAGAALRGGDDTSGRSAQIHATPRQAGITSTGPAGKADIYADSLGVSISTTRTSDGNKGYLSVDFTGSNLTATDGVSGDYGRIMARPRELRMSLQDGSGNATGEVRVIAGTTSVASASPDGQKAEITTGPTSGARLGHTSASGVYRRIEVTPQGFYLATNATGSVVRTNLETLASASGPWVTLKLINGWKAYTGGGGYFPGIRARVTPVGLQIQGMIAGGATGTVAILPAAMQPEYARIFPAPASGNVTAYCSVSLDSGAMAIRYNSGPSTPSFAAIDAVLPMTG